MFSFSYRTGTTVDKTKKDDPSLAWLSNLPTWLFPNVVIWAGLLIKFLEKLGYGITNNGWKEVPEATKFYHGLSLTVGSEARGMGLGKELIKRTLKIGKEKDCSHCYILASSIYSQRIFKDLGFQVLHEEAYDEFHDKNGEIFFKDMREHKTCQVVLYDLNNIDF